LGITEDLTQLSALAAAPLLLILLVYFSGKVLHAFSHSSSKKKHERNGTEELLQLLVLSELLDARHRQLGSLNGLTSSNDQED
jgi:hypothetical protein